MIPTSTILAFLDSKRSLDQERTARNDEVYFEGLIVVAI